MNNKKLILIDNFPPCIGGIQTIIYNLCKNYPEKEIIVLAQKINGYKEFDKKQNFKIYRMQKLLWGNRPYIMWLPLSIVLLYICLKEKIKTIHFATILPFGILGNIFKKFLNIEYIVYTFALEIIAPQKNINSKKRLINILKNAKKVITISEFTKKILLDLDVKQEKIVKIPLGINIEIFYKKEKNISLIKKYNLENTFILLSVGRLVQRKGFDMVIKSLKYLKHSNIKYLIVGDGGDKVRLEKIILEENVKDKVIFAGKIKHELTADYYNLCDIFLMPSRQIKEEGDAEGFGIVFSEASACGKPVIAGNSGGIRDAVIENVNGFLIDPEDPFAIADKINKLISDKEFYNKLSINAVNHVKKNMSWIKSIELIEK